jgi:hypothetical protein
MAGPSGSPHFQARFESALLAYQTKTGITLAEHPLAVQLQSCNTVESITTLVQGQAQAFSNSRESDRIMKSITTTLSILTPLSAAAPLADAVDLVRQIAMVVRFTFLTLFFCSHSHPQKQYRLVSLSYLMYVPLSKSYADTLVTSKWTRQPKA